MHCLESTSIGEFEEPPFEEDLTIAFTEPNRSPQAGRHMGFDSVVKAAASAAGKKVGEPTHGWETIKGGLDAILKREQEEHAERARASVVDIATKLQALKSFNNMISTSYQPLISPPKKAPPEVTLNERGRPVTAPAEPFANKIRMNPSAHPDLCKIQPSRPTSSGSQGPQTRAVFQLTKAQRRALRKRGSIGRASLSMMSFGRNSIGGRNSTTEESWGSSV